MADLAPLILSKLSHTFDGTPILNGVNLRVEAGEFVALLGPSGCGKTTLLRAIAGLVTPRLGSISIDGNCVVEDGAERLPCEQRGVGLVFQEYALFPNLTVAENVGYGLSTGDTARVNGLLELVGMTELAHRKPAQLSGGQQQRVALARALAPRPALLLLDEPFANVDAALRDSLGRMLRRVVRDEGASVLMVTHDQRSALGLADRVVVLGAEPTGGEIIQDDLPARVYRCPASKGVAQLTGPCMLIEGVATGEKASTALGMIPLIDNHTGEVVVTLRPEQLRFTPAEAGTCTVEDAQFAGSVHHLRCSSPAGLLEVVVPSGEDTPSIGTVGQIEILEDAWALPVTLIDRW